MTGDAVDLARRFIDAFNARDLDALRKLAADDIELRKPQGAALHGHDGLRALVMAADDVGLVLVLADDATVDEQDGRTRLTMPVGVSLGRDQLHGAAEIEVAGGRVAAFEVLTGDRASA